MEEEAKLVPKNGSDCESNRASSAAANGNYDLCGRTPTSELTMDEISPASLINHDDRSERTLSGPRGASIFFVFFVVYFGLDHFFGFHPLVLKKVEKLLELAITKFYNGLGAVDRIIFWLLLSGFFSYFLRLRIERICFWERGDCIGDGGCGIVYVEQNRKTGDKRAVKELINFENAESLRKEIKILCQLKHPNIVKYYGHEEDGHKISLYMEFIESGSLKKYILKRGALHETLIRKFIAQILTGLVYLHSKRVVHRDLKPENILVDSQDIIKLVDFGLSKHLAKSVDNHSKLGTPYFAAPEVLRKEEYKSSDEAYAADIWSLGGVIIEMFSGKHPWPDYEPQQAFYKVSVKNQPPPIPDELCEDGKDFLKQCFGITPADRPSAEKLQNHFFVKPQNLSC